MRSSNVILGFALLTAASSASGAGLSIADVVSIRNPVAAAISPDGSAVAYIVQEPNDDQHSKDPTETTVWVWSAKENLARPYGKSLRGAASPKWSVDGTALAFTAAAAPGGGRQLYFVSPSGEKQHAIPFAGGSFSWSPEGARIAYLAPEPESVQARRTRELGDDEVHVRFSGADQPLRRQQLWTVDPQTGTNTLVDTGASNVVGFEWSPKGSKFLLTVADPSDEEQLHPRIMVTSSSGGDAKQFCKTSGKVMTASWSPDGNAIAYLGTTEGASDPYPGGLFLCRQGAIPENLIATSPFTVEGYRWMPDSESLLLVIAQGAHRSLAKMTIRDQKIVRLTHQPWEIAFRSPFSISADGRRIACILSSSSRPPDLWLVNAGGDARQLTHLNPNLETRTYGEAQEFRWRANDGLELSGVLIKPVGYRQGARYPLIAQVHGSQVADTTEFQASWMNWGQLLAAHGYAVLLPNYRGSLTSGARFARADQGDLGGKDLGDVLGGVDALIREGIADPDRLGIGGVSYGGFLTARAVTQTTRFKAAVMGIGIGNWVSMAGETPGPLGMVALYWIHSPYEDTNLLWDRSPLAHAGNVKTPTLIYAGERDPLVPVSQSREFFRALKHFGVPTEFIIYPREGHSVLEPRHLTDNLGRILGWFDEYLKK